MGYLNEGARQIRIIEYDAVYKQQVIDLILQIQNDEFQVGLPLAEQPDLLDVPSYYEKDGGAFLLALAGGLVIGTLAFMNYGAGNAVLKKFFVRADHRGTGVGFALYQELMQRIGEGEYKRVLLDTPAVATKSHRFYERQGFKRVPKEAIPFDYVYPDRNSYLYLLELYGGATRE